MFAGTILMVMESEMPVIIVRMLIILIKTIRTKMEWEMHAITANIFQMQNRQILIMTELEMPVITM